MYGKSHCIVNVSMCTLKGHGPHEKYGFNLKFNHKANKSDHWAKASEMIYQFVKNFLWKAPVSVFVENPTPFITFDIYISGNVCDGDQYLFGLREVPNFLCEVVMN